MSDQLVAFLCDSLCYAGYLFVFQGLFLKFLSYAQAILRDRTDNDQINH